LDKDAALWLEDGNIVIIAQNTAFRVHRGVLARQSEVFSSLFTVPQPTDVNEIEQVDGCPVVHVQDSAHDLRDLLRALYDGLDIYLTSDAPVLFSILAALIRLSHKYELERIQTVTIKRLALVLADRAKLWRAYEGRKNPFVVFRRGDAIEAANLLRICGREDLLPAALYMCCALDVRTLLHGVRRADGTREMLPLGDLECCLRAQTRLEGRSAAFVRRVLDVNHPDRPPACPLNCDAALSELWRSRGALKDNEHTKRWVFVDTVGTPAVRDPCGICRPCAQHIVSVHTMFLDTLWSELPSLLGMEVPNWPP
ncbi:hypothetical protein BD413DRAFT_443941, partial [Trametes elegans]